VQVAFSVTDEQGKEEIITGEIPYTDDLFPPIPGERLAEHSPWCFFDSGETATQNDGCLRFGSYKSGAWLRLRPYFFSRTLTGND